MSASSFSRANYEPRMGEKIKVNECATTPRLGLAVKGVFCVQAEEPALHAFEEMIRLGLSAAGVLRSTQPTSPCIVSSLDFIKGRGAAY